MSTPYKNVTRFRGTGCWTQPNSCKTRRRASNLARGAEPGRIPTECCEPFFEPSAPACPPLPHSKPPSLPPTFPPIIPHPPLCLCVLHATAFCLPRYLPSHQVAFRLPHHSRRACTYLLAYPIISTSPCLLLSSICCSSFLLTCRLRTGPDQPACKSAPTPLPTYCLLICFPSPCHGLYSRLAYFCDKCYCCCCCCHTRHYHLTHL
jgi:hypothetical protein